MAETANRNRRADLKAALKRVKPDDVMTLDDAAILWGTAKSRFVTVRNQMAKFPPPQKGEGNKYDYPAKAAIEAMLDHELRFDAATKKRGDRINAILGKSGKRADLDEQASLSVTELARLNTMAAEIEEREREQGAYVPVAGNAALASEIFSLISEFHRELSNKLDPHGLLPPALRAQIDSLGEEFLLRLHGQMKDVLSPDAKPKKPRGAAGRTGRASSRR